MTSLSKTGKTRGPRSEYSSNYILNTPVVKEIIFFFLNHDNFETHYSRPYCVWIQTLPHLFLIKTPWKRIYPIYGDWASEGLSFSFKIVLLQPTIILYHDHWSLLWSFMKQCSLLLYCNALVFSILFYLTF